MKEEKKSHSLIQNVWYILRHMWEWDKRDIGWMVLTIPGSVIISLLETYMAKNVVQLVTEQAAPAKLIVYVLLFSLGLLLLYSLNHVATFQAERGYRVLDDRFLLMYQDKYMQVDYEKLENPEFQLFAERAVNGVQQGQVSRMLEKTSSLFAAVLGLITYAMILFPLSPAMILMMIAISTGGYFIYGYNHKWERANRDRIWAPVWKRMEYNSKRIRDPQAAKDIRIFGMGPLLTERFQETLKDFVQRHRYSQIRWRSVDTIFACMTAARDFLAYGILIYKVYSEGMSAAEFVLYFNALMMFVRWLLQLYDGIDMARFPSYQFCDFRDFIEDENSTTGWGNLSVSKEECKIEFKNVEYQYPGSDRLAFSQGNFTIATGEKIAVVGPNGAGKTTMVKLMCGLYQPTNGDILVNDHRIQEYSKESYFRMIAPVFQDIVFLPKTISDNITMCLKEEKDEEKLQKAIRFSGLERKLERLPKGQETLLVKEVQDGAIALSGGEAQKLALARALYKEGTLLILDEPTAALDPIAESEVYQKYNELAAGKTSVFISHRLASTRFCNRIFYVEEGKIVEMGTHEELMKLGGKYAKMFEVQSQYYKEDVQIRREEGVRHE